MKLGYFEERVGEDIRKSSTRLQMFISMFFAFFVIGYQVVTKDIDNVLIIILLTASFAPKTISKFAEKTKVN